MLQTWWDTNKQIIRKAIDALAGLVGGWLIAQGEWGAALAPLVVVAVNFVWFWLDNRNKATVKGLVEAGQSHVAVALEDAIAIEEKKADKKK